MFNEAMNQLMTEFCRLCKHRYVPEFMNERAYVDLWCKYCRVPEFVQFVDDETKAFAMVTNASKLGPDPMPDKDDALTGLAAFEKAAEMAGLDPNRMDSFLEQVKKQIVGHSNVILPSMQREVVIDHVCGHKVKSIVCADNEMDMHRRIREESLSRCLNCLGDGDEEGCG